MVGIKIEMTIKTSNHFNGLLNCLWWSSPSSLSHIKASPYIAIINRYDTAFAVSGVIRPSGWKNDRVAKQYIVKSIFISVDIFIEQRYKKKHNLQKDCAWI
jgi:hypothetical protein